MAVVNAKRRVGFDQWKKAHGGTGTEAQYEKWWNDRHVDVRDRAIGLITRIQRSGMSVNEIVARTALSAATVRKYNRGGFGKRGPLLTTYLALRGRF